MDFFAQQSAKKRSSSLLLLLFVVAMLMIGLLIHVLISGFSLLLGQPSLLWAPSLPAMTMIAIVWLAIFAGCLFRWSDVRAGGAMLARRLGAVHASDRARHEQEKRLLNVVAEVSIASSTVQPDVYVLRQETSINAFVLGHSADRAVIVVTQGALDAFDRDQLQAVIAHEFGHISNGDLPLNMRILIALAGLMAIDEVGRWLYQKGPDDALHPGKIVGALMIVIGSVGVLSGTLIRAAYNRQRELLADASAVQFTRNPVALASALDTIRQTGHESPLHLRQANELIHLCFHAGSYLDQWYTRMLSSHPCLSVRIETIDSHHTVKQRQRSRQASSETEGRLTSGAGFKSTVESGFESGLESGVESEVLDSSGFYSLTPTAAQPVAGLIDLASATSLTDHLEILLTDEQSCLAVLFALFASSDATKQTEYLKALTFSMDQQFAQRVGAMLKAFPKELTCDQLGIISHACAMLRQTVACDQRHLIVKRLEQMAKLNGQYDLMSYATVQLIRQQLDVDFPILDCVANESLSVAQGRKVKNFELMGREFALLLSLMIETSGASAAELDRQFSRVLKCYTQHSYPRRTANETGIVDDLEAAFQTLYVQPESIRQAFVQHCMEIMMEDGRALPEEQAMLNLFAASLRCEALIPAVKKEAAA